MMNSENRGLGNSSLKIIFSMLILSALVITCRPAQKDDHSRISAVKIGMTYVEVLESIGAPDTVLHRGVVMDEFGSQTKTDEWYYGSNSMVVMVNDTVNAVDTEVLETQRRIRYIIDSARAAEAPR